MQKISCTALQVRGLKKENLRSSEETPSTLIQTLNFKDNAVAKVDSLTVYQPAGGQVKILNSPINFRAAAKSRIGSLDNSAHKPRGGDRKVTCCMKLYEFMR